MNLCHCMVLKTAEAAAECDSPVVFFNLSVLYGLLACFFYHLDNANNKTWVQTLGSFIVAILRPISWVFAEITCSHCPVTAALNRLLKYTHMVSSKLNVSNVNDSTD